MKKASRQITEERQHSGWGREQGRMEEESSKIVRKPTHWTVSSTRVRDSPQLVFYPEPTTVPDMELLRNKGMLNKLGVRYEGF